MTYSSIRTLLIAFLCTGIAACGSEDASEAPESDAATADSTASEAGGNAAERASRLISGEAMREYVVELSDDRYEGRGPGSRGDEAARAYLIEEMKRIGLQPGAADGGWEQEFSYI